MAQSPGPFFAPYQVPRIGKCVLKEGGETVRANHHDSLASSVLHPALVGPLALIVVDWLDFIASLVRSLAWPVAICMVAWLLRVQIRGLLGRLETVQHKETVASFTRKVEEVSEQVKPSDPQVEEHESLKGSGAPGEGDPTVGDRVARLEKSLTVKRDREAATRVQTLAATLADYPSAAVLAAWGELENGLRRKTSALGLVPGVNTQVPTMVSVLDGAGVLSSSDVEAIQGLRRLRNEAAHGQVEPSSAAAIEYAATVDRLLSKVER